MSDLYLGYHYRDQLLSMGQFLTIILLNQVIDLLTKYKRYIIKSVELTKKLILIELLLYFMKINLKVCLIKSSHKLDH